MIDSEQYIPGIRNIGPKEVAKRRALGWIGLVASVLFWATCVFFHMSPPWRLLLFVPVTLSSLGFLQAGWHFCAQYGLKGAFKFGSTNGRVDSVEQTGCRGKDRQTALLIIGLSALIALAVAAAAYYIQL
jgi:hypothetical protein